MIQNISSFTKRNTLLTVTTYPENIFKFEHMARHEDNIRCRDLFSLHFFRMISNELNSRYALSMFEKHMQIFSNLIIDGDSGNRLGGGRIFCECCGTENDF